MGPVKIWFPIPARPSELVITMAGVSAHHSSSPHFQPWNSRSKFLLPTSQRKTGFQAKTPSISLPCSSKFSIWLPFIFFPPKCEITTQKRSCLPKDWVICFFLHYVSSFFSPLTSFSLPTCIFYSHHT